MTAKHIMYDELSSFLFHTWYISSMSTKYIDKHILSIELGVESIAKEYGIEILYNPITNRIAKLVEPKED